MEGMYVRLFVALAGIGLIVPIVANAAGASAETVTALTVAGATLIMGSVGFFVSRFLHPGHLALWVIEEFQKLDRSRQIFWILCGVGLLAYITAQFDYFGA